MNKLIAIAVILGIGTFVGFNSLYTVSEVEQVIITQFGKTRVVEDFAADNSKLLRADHRTRYGAGALSAFC